MLKANEKSPMVYVFGEHPNRHISVVISGKNLMVHRYTESLRCRGIDKRSPREMAKDYLYVNKKGQMYLPSGWFEKAMSDAGVNFLFKGKKTYRDIIRSDIQIKPEEIIQKIKKWEVDSRYIYVPPGANNPHIERHRPVFPKWEVEFTIEVRNPDLDLNILAEILEYAGRYIGVGDHRPQNGRFEIIKFELCKEVA